MSKILVNSYLQKQKMNTSNSGTGKHLVSRKKVLLTIKTKKSLFKISTSYGYIRMYKKVNDLKGSYDNLRLRILTLDFSTNPSLALPRICKDLKNVLILKRDIFEKIYWLAPCSRQLGGTSWLAPYSRQLRVKEFTGWLPAVANEDEYEADDDHEHEADEHTTSCSLRSQHMDTLYIPVSMINIIKKISTQWRGQIKETSYSDYQKETPYQGGVEANIFPETRSVRFGSSPQLDTSSRYTHTLQKNGDEPRAHTKILFTDLRVGRGEGET